MKKLFSLLLCLCLMGSLLVGCGGSKDDTAKKEDTEQAAANDEDLAETKSSQNKDSNSIVLGYYGGTCEAPLFIAYENGYFEEQGLDVELTMVTQDTAMLVSTNKIDAIMITPALFPGMAEGLDMKILDAAHTGCIQGATKPDSGINSAADLKGKKIGVAAEGDVPQLQLSEEMRQAGLDPETDVEWVVYPDPQLEMALEKGEIDAFASWDPFTTMAVENGYKLYFSTTTDEFFKNDICCFYAMNPKTLENNPDLGKKFIAALSQAHEFITTKPEEAANIIIDKEYTVGDVDMTAKLLGDYEWVSNDKARDEESIKKILSWCKNGGAIAKDVDPDKFIEDYLVYSGK